MSDDNALWQEWEGRIVPRQFSIGYVVLSYIVSYVGTLTTLELFNQRTAGRGLYNWSLLLGSSVSMGGIAIWCMHYIGNRAIVLGSGQDELQIAYSSGFTALSFFVPIIVLLVAFIALGSDDKVSIFRVSIGGSLAGSAICGMHYLGQAGVSNYTCVYDIKNIIGSAVIAVFASVVALSVFFVLRATWTNSWWKRALCAIILAGAVSGMHWLASVGTQYRLKQVASSSPSNNISRNATVIVVIVLSITACFILLVFTMLAQRRRRRSANRAQQVVLACAVFDRTGKIMVTNDGLLPNTKVTTSYIERSLDGIFGTSHAVFQWIFRATHNWSSVSSLLPAMRLHLGRKSILQRSGLESMPEGHIRGAGGEAPEDYSFIFREQFCVAAAEIAEELGETLDRMGVLFDQILNTGQSTASSKRIKHLESGKTTYIDGRGLLLFVVRVVERETAERLSGAGYRFTDPQNVAGIISRRMQINSGNFGSHLKDMNEYASESHLTAPGVHLACFAIRASIGGGFDVLVRKDARSRLPTIQLPFDNLDKWKIDYLSRLDNWTVGACSKFLSMKSVDPTSSKEEQRFAIQFLRALSALRDDINHHLFADALLVSKPVFVPCQQAAAEPVLPQATLIAFRLMLPIQFRSAGEDFQFTPLSFFRLQQYEYRNGSDQALFARTVHREFGPVLIKDGASIDTTQNGVRSPTFLGRAFGGLKAKRSTNDVVSFEVSNPATRHASDSSSERKLVDGQNFGGIMVSQEVSVDITDGYEGAGADSNDDISGMEMFEMGYTAEMGTSGRATKEEEDKTFVDTLFARCVESR